MASVVGSSDSEAHIMLTFSKKSNFSSKPRIAIGRKNLTIKKNSKTFLTVSNRLCFRLTN
jgi:hypothetical protein